MSDLTDRQQQVASLLADGLSAPEVGEKLGITTGTVEQHRFLIYKQLGITNIVDLTKYALARGWVRNQYAKGRPRKPS